MEAVMNLIEPANVYLTEQFGDLGPLLIIGVLGLFLVLLTLPILLKKQKDPFDQIRKAAQAGATDDAEGKARLRVGEEDKEVGPGSILYVRATEDHSFFDITEDLTLLAFFGRADLSA